MKKTKHKLFFEYLDKNEFLKAKKIIEYFTKKKKSEEYINYLWAIYYDNSKVMKTKVELHRNFTLYRK